ncbi:hypothetical protein [Salinimicrobium profundisediminis]|uniref:Addiction module protein n=1 Tax=Salinimicrobium profundisediminis TaxID=2994553 RepID=A0A9X3I0Q0_9FLAO|nr:hypothetical protein [Salinimicrobium profundisediminis]MCX2837157.1 hypothetical protein [Salinimicrobium profundisediminis]
MDLPAEKYKLIEWLLSLEDEDIVRRLQEIRNETSDPGDSYEISDTERLFIEAGLKDIEEGKIYSHEDIMREIKEKYNI